MTNWWDTDRQHRRIIHISAGKYERFDRPIDIHLSSPIQRPRLMEIDEDGNIHDRAVNLQLDGETLIFLLKGTTPANTTRLYHLYYDEGPEADDVPSAPALVSLTADIDHEGFSSYRIAAQNATYYYHQQGAGFASMIDIDGNDWINFHPWGGSDGNYRGIPNVAHPESHFHPGRDGCTSEVAFAGPLKVTIHSRSNDDKWACQWEIYPAYARLTVLTVDHPYWFLYEGTPGGILDEAGDYMVRSDGKRIPASERWEGALPAPEWIYFGAANTDRVLYLVHYEADDKIDSYWPMEHNMTVFGFGRNGIEKFMTHTPAHFTIGFAESGQFELAQKTINAAYQPVETTVGEVETKPASRQAN